MSRKRKGLNLKSVIAVVLTVMFVIGAISIVLASPLPDKLDKTFSDVFPSDTTDKPSGGSTGNNTTPGDSDNTGNKTVEILSPENYVGPLEFNGGITNSESSSGPGIELPIIRPTD